MTSESRRADLIAQLRQRGVQSQRVLGAMARVPRERFVAPQASEQAYEDRALPIDCSQTISQPTMVALMTDALQLEGTEKVLEIGTGSGYQTAILAELACEVVSLERHAALSAQAARRLAEQNYTNVRLVVADGVHGWPAEAPYDRILVTAAAGDVPQPLLEQLAEGGILVIPVGDAESQVLQAIHRHAGEFSVHNLTECRFVPFVGTQPPG